MENVEIISKPAVRGGEVFKKTKEEKEQLKIAKHEYKKWVKLHGIK